MINRTRRIDISPGEDWSTMFIHGTAGSYIQVIGWKKTKKGTCPAKIGENGSKGRRKRQVKELRKATMTGKKYSHPSANKKIVEGRGLRDGEEAI